MGHYQRISSDSTSNRHFKLIDEFKQKMNDEINKYKQITLVNFEESNIEGSAKCFDYHGYYGRDAFVALGTDLGTLCFFDCQKETITQILSRPDQGPITCVKISKQGEFVAIANEKSIQIIQMKDRKVIQTINNPFIKASVTAMVITPDEKFLILGSSDQEIKFFDIQSGACTYNSEDKIKRVKDEIIPVKAIAITSDGKYAIFGWGERSIIMFGLANMSVKHEFKNYQDDPVVSIAISDDNKFFVSGSEDGSVVIFSIEHEEFIHKFDAAHDESVISLALTWDSSFIVSTSSDETIRVFDVQRKTFVHTYEEPHQTRMVGILLTNPQKQFIAISQKNIWIRMYSRMEDFAPRIITDYRICEIELTEDQKTIAVGSYEGHIYIYDFQNNSLQRSIFFGSKAKITSIVYTNNENEIIVGSDAGVIKAFNYQTGELIHDYDYVHNGVVYLKFSPWDYYVYSGSEDKSIGIIDPKQKSVIFHKKLMHEKEITGIAITPKYLITIAADKFVKLFDLVGRNTLHEFLLYEGYPSCVTVTKNHSHIICGSTKGTLHIFDIECLEAYQVLQGQKRMIFAVDISADNTFIFSSSIDGTVKVYDFARRELIYNLNYNAKDPYFLRLVLSQDFIIYHVQGGTGVFTTQNPLSINSSSLVITTSNQYSPFISFQIYLLKKLLTIKDLSFQKQVIRANKDLRIYPFGWNFFHFVALFCPNKDLIRFCMDLQIPFSLDNNQETPLHYLMDAKAYDFGLINYILDNFKQILPENIPACLIIKSLSNQIPKILVLDTPSVVNFLNVSFGKPLKYKNEEIPYFGKIRNGKKFKFYANRSPVLMPDIRDVLINEKADGKLSVWMLSFYIDYHIMSDDLLKIAATLINCQEEAIFKTKTISLLIDHIWQFVRIYHMGLNLIYSQGMITFSVYVGLAERNLGLEIVCLINAFLYLIHEILQVTFAGWRIYISDIWNVIDIMTTALLIAFPICIWSGAQEFIVSWLMSLAIFLGFLRWISFFRIFDKPRRFVRTLLEIVKDMQSFLATLVLIIFGFSLIFRTFKRQIDFADTLKGVYELLYSNFDFFQNLSISEYIFFIVVTIALSIILLNLLIAIMGDTYARVQELYVMTDSKEKLSMSLETMTMLRAISFLLCRKRRQVTPYAGQKGFLYYIKEGTYFDDELYGTGHAEWEGRLKSMKKFIKGEARGQIEAMNKQYTNLKEEVNSIKQDVSLIKTYMKQLTEHLGRRKDEEASPNGANEVLNPYLVRYMTKALDIAEITKKKEDAGDGKKLINLNSLVG